MSDEDRNEAAVGENAAEKAGDARKTRGIRFSESEWEDVKRAAAGHEMPAAEFVRERILRLHAHRKARKRLRQRRPSHR